MTGRHRKPIRWTQRAYHLAGALLFVAFIAGSWALMWMGV